MSKLFHHGSPCDPPVVNGFEFKPSEDHEGLFVADVPDDAKALFDGIPSFSGDPEKLTAPVVEEKVGIAALEPPTDIAALVAENKALKENAVDASAKIGTLEAENSELRARMAELEAELESEQDGDIQKEGQDIEAPKADIAALEAKKAEKGKLSPAEAKKLEKLQKRMAEVAPAQ